MLYKIGSMIVLGFLLHLIALVDPGWSRAVDHKKVMRVRVGERSTGVRSDVIRNLF